MMGEISRREVLKLAGLTVATPVLRPTLAGMAAPSDDTLPRLPELPVARPEPAVVQAELTAAWTPARVAGFEARLQTYNGSFPGPVLRVREGDQVHLRFLNGLPEPTNLHLHGLHLPPTVDDPFRMIAPGEAVTYTFELPPGSAGTHWYHPHIHGAVGRQLFAGLAGPLVVDGPLDRQSRLRRAEEHVLVLKDLTLSDGLPAAHTMFDWINGKEGDLVLVNGALQPTIVARRGTQRWRVLNASNARYYRLRLDGLPWFLIGTDGGLIEQPVAAGDVLLAPGERVDLLVQLDRAGTFDLLDAPYDRGGHMRGPGMAGGMRTRPAAGTVLVRVVVPDGLRPLALPGRLRRLERLDAARADHVRQVVLTERMMAAEFFINGQTFDPTRVDFQGRLGDLEVWEIRNRTMMDHPMHLHTFPFQVLSRNGVPERLLAWKDVVNVRPGEVVRLAVPLRDYTGRTVYHCHIVEHEDRGMMGVLEV